MKWIDEKEKEEKEKEEEEVEQPLTAFAGYHVSLYY